MKGTSDVLELINLKKVFDNNVVAVDGISLSVKPGEIFCTLGGNGAGKTTIMMMILGFTEPTEGTARICGVDIRKDPLEAKKHVAYVSENVQLYGNFTGMQNLDFFTKLAGRKRVPQEEFEQVLKRVGLSKDAHRRRVKGYSKGMRQRLGIAIAIMKQAEVILLDEPTSGLDPKGGVEFLRLLNELRKENKAIFMTTHDIFRAKEIADRIGIQKEGHMIKILDREEVQREDLNDIYLKYVEMSLADAKSGMEGQAV
ncbi:ABC transporter ATP-binding protein [Candidatus Hydrogenedentota bacterium]